jgi:hypothetical protein
LFQVFFIKSMNHQKYRTRRDGSNRYPAFFLFNGIVTLRNGKRIVKDENGSFKTDIVFVEILPILVFIPLEARVQRATLYNLAAVILFVNTTVRTPDPSIAERVLQSCRGEEPE